MDGLRLAQKLFWRLGGSAAASEYATEPCHGDVRHYQVERDEPGGGRDHETHGDAGKQEDAADHVRRSHAALRRQRNGDHRAGESAECVREERWREMLGLIQVNIGCDACSVIDIDALGRWHDRRAGSDDSPVHHAAHDESDEAGQDVAEDVRHGGVMVVGMAGGVLFLPECKWM